MDDEEVNCWSCDWYDGVTCDKSGLRKQHDDVCDEWESRDIRNDS